MTHPFPWKLVQVSRSHAEPAVAGGSTTVVVAGTVMVGRKESCRDCPPSLVHRMAEAEGCWDSSKADQKAGHN